MNPPESIIGVKTFIGILNETLSFAYPVVIVEGEVSGFKVSQGKWAFFDLKDEDATLPCFIPIYQLKVPLEDGMKVQVSGTPKVTNWGKFSFTAKSVTLAGEGALKRAFELLKLKLEREGLFESARKRALPSFPRSIGLITSGKSAAYSDFVKILGARWGGLQIKLADIQVQGAAAPDQIIGAIEYFNQSPLPVDVVVLIRGGGSLEDLQAFNTEGVARAVAASRTPIVVGVGHEIDVSLADFAADVRAATPTDAARLVAPDRREVGARVAANTREISLRMVNVVKRSQDEVSRFLKIGGHLLAGPHQRVERAEALLLRDIGYIQSALRRHQNILAGLTKLLPGRVDAWLRHAGDNIRSQQRLLHGYDPAGNLRRGYSISWYKGVIVRSVDQVPDQAAIMVQLADGKLTAQVLDNDKTDG